MEMTAKPAARVYMMAFACEPGRGSEPGVGFSFATALAASARETGRPATLVTRPHRVSEIRQGLNAAGLGDVLTILPVSLPPWLVAITGRTRVRLAYLVWQAIAVEKVRRDIAARAAHAIVHHVTFATEGLPTFEWRLDSAASRIFGPAGSIATSGGGRGLYRRFADQSRRRVRAWAADRNLKGVRLAIAQNRHVLEEWNGVAPNALVEPNIAVDLATVAANAVKQENLIVSLGRLIPRKQHHLALQTLSLLPGEYVLHIVGGGPLRQDLQRLASDLGIADRVVFTGSLDRDEALAVLARAEILLHLSRQEGAPWAVGEAQALGVFPIALEGSGADDMIRLASLGSVVSNAEAAAQAVLARRGNDLPESDRWSAGRLPGLLADWYAQVDSGC
jgi:glycosyltransferase involved in cell wall biosynthesis